MVTGHTHRVTIRDPIPTRRAPTEMRLPVPGHVQLWGAVLGFGTALLGFLYLSAFTPNRRPELEAISVVAKIETPLAWFMLAAGGWVVVATAVSQARSSAHAIAAVVHSAHLVALGATFVIAYPLASAPGVVQASFAVIAHGGACLEYWQRGWR